MRIYVFGNPLIKEDSLPLKLISQLKKIFPKIEFVTADPNENFPPKNEKDLVILDTIKGIKEPIILDLDDFNNQSSAKTPISPHDYDLLFHLLLLKKLKRVNKILIIGIPLYSQYSRVYEKILSLISQADCLSLEK